MYYVLPFLSANFTHNFREIKVQVLTKDRLYFLNRSRTVLQKQIRVV